MAQNSGIPARNAALELLDAVLSDKVPLDQILHESPKFQVLENSDRSFARLLVSTCLRNLGEIDLAIDGFLNRPLAPSALQVRHVLRIGATQLMFLETAHHAAVDTSVSIVKKTQLAGFSGLVNAIMRKLTTVERLPLEEAAQANTPEWLYTTWVKEYGEEKALGIAVAHQSEPPLDFTARATPSDVASQLNGSVMPTLSVRHTSAGDVTSLPGYAEGDWWVQDAAAALPAQLIPNPSGRTILDLCAAPGGKAAQLAAAGAQVTAVDRSEKRLALVRENFKRLNMDVSVVTGDIGTWRPRTSADAVLLDAPCTATGTIRRHPDIPYLKEFSDVRRLAKLQSELINAAARMVNLGGHLVYAVCSLQPEEGPRVVNKFLLNNSAFARDPIQPDELPGIADFLTPAGDLRTLPSNWPEHGGMDGFFAARLKRVSAT